MSPGKPMDQPETIEQLGKLAAELGVDIPVRRDVSVLAEPVKAGPLMIPNSLAVQPMEGCDGDSLGRPRALTFRRYRRFAAGGAGLVWVEATAVTAEGRAGPRQLWLHENSLEAFADLVAHIRQTAATWPGRGHRPVIVLQLTHSGRYSRPEGIPKPLLPQHDPYRDAMLLQASPDSGCRTGLPAEAATVTDDYLDSLVERYAEAASLAFEAGFDAVDVKSCHGYLIAELLSARDREGKYGGSLENRMRFLLAVVDAIRSRTGGTVVTRLGVYDGIPYPYGWGVQEKDFRKPDLSEPKKLIAELEKRGVPLVNITAGNPYYNPHVNRPFNEPVTGGYDSPEHPLCGVARLVSLASEVQKASGELVTAMAGCSWLGTLFAEVAAGVKASGSARIIGAGRMAFAYPDFAADILEKGMLDQNRVCISCSSCTQIMRDGGRAGCPVRDGGVYGPIYRKGRIQDRENLVRLAERCRQCGIAECRLGCPAGVDIRGFVKRFCDGDDRGAYEILRQANTLPLVCGYLCPVEQQCEGRCVEGLLGDSPVPIAAVQRYLAAEAVGKGWAQLKLPRKVSGKRVAIVGGGPAGLACTAALLEAGHTVMVFNKSGGLGGLINSVIPPDRYEQSLKDEIAAIFAGVPEGRMAVVEKPLAVGFDLDAIAAEGFDAVFLGMGLPQSIRKFGQKRQGLYGALEFLAAAGSEGELELSGKHTAVIGGGNTAIDTAMAANRLGAADVYVIYRRSFEQMPAWRSMLADALEAGIHLLLLTDVLAIKPESGPVKSITVCPTRLAGPDESSRRRPLPLTKSSYELPMDLVVEAIGQQSVEDLAALLPEVEIVEGLVKTVGDTLETTRRGVFAGGDIVRGPSTVVAAVADGMAAARQIDRYLKKVKKGVRP